MALVALIRGVNVGGHRTFRPSILAKELSEFDVVSVGTAGTFIVRKSGSSRARLRAELRRRLPFEAEIMLCEGRDLIRLEIENPFGARPSRSDVVRFVSILSKARRAPTFVPVSIPSRRNWLVRVIASKKQFLFGEYRRNLKTIRYLGQLDELFGATATTRNWKTIRAIIRILRGPKKQSHIGTMRVRTRRGRAGSGV